MLNENLGFNKQLHLRQRFRPPDQARSGGRIILSPPSGPVLEHTSLFLVLYVIVELIVLVMLMLMVVVRLMQMQMITSATTQ